MIFDLFFIWLFRCWPDRFPTVRASGQNSLLMVHNVEREELRPADDLPASPASSDIRTCTPDTEKNGNPLTTGLQYGAGLTQFLPPHTAITSLSTSVPAGALPAQDFST